MPVNHRQEFERNPDAELYISVVIPNQVGFDEIKLLVGSPEDALAKSQQIYADVDSFIAQRYGVTQAAYQLYKSLIKDPTCRATDANGVRCKNSIPWQRLPMRLDGFTEDANCYCNNHQN
ncbi:MAG: hypothetical protein ACPGVA_03285 [Pikeienuella sp.]